MSSHELKIENCGCYPYTAPMDGGACSPCSPNMILTCREEAILSVMRDIKGQVRKISARMKEIQRSFGESLTDPHAEQSNPEWRQLARDLESLRTQWSDWQEKLEEAIEYKLILLGHRQPPKTDS